MESGRIEKGKMMEKWENRKDFSFPHLCLVRGWKSKGMKNFFVWLKIKFIQIYHHIPIK